MGLAHEFDTLLEAARQLSKSDIRFLFIGGGPRVREIDSRARKLGACEFRGTFARVARGASHKSRSRDVHIVTLRQGMPGLLVPSKIYGILAAGKPTIYVGPSVGEVVDIVTIGGCGVAVNNGDVSSLVEAIESYQRDTVKRHAHGEAARALYEERFTKTRAMRQFTDLIPSLQPVGSSAE